MGITTFENSLAEFTKAKPTYQHTIQYILYNTAMTFQGVYPAGVFTQVCQKIQHGS